MDEIKQELIDGKTVLFLGMGVFENLTCKDDSKLPYDSDSFVLALNNGRAMSPRLMYEYTRAAMSLEQRKGREYLVAMTNHIYTSKEYGFAKAYELVQALKPKYIIDTNLDESICKIYADEPHFMITGVSRVMGGYDRYVIYRFDVEKKEYIRVDKSELDDTQPIIFKPMGCVIPEKNFIVSDADFVDWLTEAMGGYAIPPFLKEYRKDKKYLFLGVDFTRDTYRMVANEMTIDLQSGYIVTAPKEYTKKESQFAQKHKLVFIEKDCDSFVEELL
jgi:hypothetical protein